MLLYHARELAMNRMEQEADALGADGIVGMRLTVTLATNPVRQNWAFYGEWQEWARRAGFPRASTDLGIQWQGWPQIAGAQWSSWCRQMGWMPEPLAPWARPRSRAALALGQNAAEFVAIGTAVRHRDGEHYRNARGKPFQSDLSGQDFWTLIRCGFRPVGFVMESNCVYYVPPHLLQAQANQSCEARRVHPCALRCPRACDRTSAGRGRGAFGDRDRRSHGRGASALLASGPLQRRERGADER